MQSQHTPHCKDGKTFAQGGSLTKEATKSRHDILKLLKVGKERQRQEAASLAPPYWCAKKASSLKEALLEVIAQELLRFINPLQPKTRVLEIYENDEPVYYVISKEIKESVPLSKLNPAIVKRNTKTGQFKGLGTISALALFINENDLRLANILIDNNNNFIKIDGDQALYRLKYQKEPGLYNITPQSLTFSPFTFQYNAYNFFDIIVHGKERPSKLFDKSVTQHPLFRGEINETLLKIALLPGGFFENFIGNYTTDNLLKTEIITELLERQAQLTISLFACLSFRQYVNSSAAETALNQFISQSKAFIPSGKTSFALFIESLVPQIMRSFEFLRHRCHQIEETTTHEKPLTLTPEKKIKKTNATLTPDQNRLATTFLPHQSMERLFPSDPGTASSFSQAGTFFRPRNNNGIINPTNLKKRKRSRARTRID